MYDAVGIEYAFDFLLEKPVGGRGGPNDADVFRNGTIKTLGELMEITANHLLERANRFKFDPIESEPGGAKVKIEISVEKLLEVAQEMKARAETDVEPEDYHWIIIGSLIETIAGLLYHFEGKGAGASQR